MMIVASVLYVLLILVIILLSMTIFRLQTDLVTYDEAIVRCKTELVNEQLRRT